MSAGVYSASESANVHATIDRVDRRYLRVYLRDRSDALTGRMTKLTACRMSRVHGGPQTYDRDGSTERPAFHQVGQCRSVNVVARRRGLVRRVDGVDTGQRRKCESDVALRHAQAEQRHGEHHDREHNALSRRRPARQADDRIARGARTCPDHVAPEKLPAAVADRELQHQLGAVAIETHVGTA